MDWWLCAMFLACWCWKRWFPKCFLTILYRGLDIASFHPPPFRFLHKGFILICRLLDLNGSPFFPRHIEQLFLVQVGDTKHGSFETLKLCCLMWIRGLRWPWCPSRVGSLEKISWWSSSSPGWVWVRSKLRGEPKDSRHAIEETWIFDPLNRSIAMVYSQYSLIAGHLQFLLAGQEIQRKPDKSGIFNRLVCVKCQTKPTSFAIRFIWVWLYMQTQSKAFLQMAHLTFSHHIYSLRFCLATACFIDPKVEPFGWFFFPWRWSFFHKTQGATNLVLVVRPAESGAEVWLCLTALCFIFLVA